MQGWERIKPADGEALMGMKQTDGIKACRRFHDDDFILKADY